LQSRSLQLHICAVSLTTFHQIRVHVKTPVDWYCHQHDGWCHGF